MLVLHFLFTLLQKIKKLEFKSKRSNNFLRIGDRRKGWVGGWLGITPPPPPSILCPSTGGGVVRHRVLNKKLPLTGGVGGLGGLTFGGVTHPPPMPNDQEGSFSQPSAQKCRKFLWLPNFRVWPVQRPFFGTEKVPFLTTTPPPPPRGLRGGCSPVGAVPSWDHPQVTEGLISK